MKLDKKLDPETSRSHVDEAAAVFPNVVTVDVMDVRVSILFQ